MSATTRFSTLSRLQRFVVQPLAIFLSVLVVVAALTQIVARTTLYFASHFTPQLNSLLASKKIRFQGISAHWKDLNPVIQIERITFGPGQLQDLEIELDTLESVARSAWIPRHVFWQQAQVHFDQTPQGWRLRNQRELVLPFDVAKSLRHVDHLFGNAQFIFHPQDGESVTYNGGITARNQQSEHFVEILLAESQSQSSTMRASWSEQSSWLDDRVLSKDVQIEGQLTIPEGLVSNAALVLDSQHVQWRQQLERGQGRLRLATRALMQDSATQSHALELLVDVGLAGTAGRIDGVSTVFRMSSGELANLRAIDLPPLHVQLLLDAVGEKPKAQAWLKGFDAATVSEVIRPSAKMWPVFAEWLQALEPSGQIHGIHGFVDASGFSGYSASVSEFNAQGYRGSPKLENAQGRLWGGGRNIAMQLNADDMTLQFPDVFTTPWPFEHVQGLVKFHVQPGLLGLRGQNIKARRHGSAIAAQFAVTRPKARFDQRLTLAVSMEEAAAQNVPDYISSKMAPGLQSWLRTAPRAGQFSEVLGAYHGQVALRDKELGRRLELIGKVRQGRIKYEARWPEVYDVSADIHLAGSTTTVRVDSAQMAGASFSDSLIELGPGGGAVDLQFKAVTDAGDVLDFVRTTPLQTALPFVGETWAASGDLQMVGQMHIPIGESPAIELSVALDFMPQNMGLSLPDFRFEIDDLRGQGSFTLPHQLQGKFVGQLFERPAAVAVTNNEQQVNFSVSGVMAPEDIYGLLDLEDAGLLQGTSRFDAMLEIAMGEGVSSLGVDTDFQGMAVKLPGEIGKQAQIASPSRFDLQFLEDFQSLRWRYQTTQGWMHLDDKILRGSIGLRVAPATIAANQQSVSIAGELASVDLDEWVRVASGASGLGVDWQMNNLLVGELAINELTFTDLSLSARQRPQEFVFSVNAEDLVGRIDLSDDARLGIDLQYLRLPELAADLGNNPDSVVSQASGDPLSIELGRSLPAAWVAIERLDVGDEAYGNWRFEIRPEQDKVHFVAVDADFRGVHLRDAHFAWDLNSDQTAFDGRVDLDNLVQTLPMWDYAPTLETQTANLQVNIQWPGSPPNVELLALQGSMDFKAKDGRFLDAETSANGLRLISLFTPSALATRINKFDFSDIVDDGMSFDRLSAKVNVGREEMVFTERMVVESPSSSFEFGGRVNLRTEALDNEMIVTLPVSNSLPWYAAYLALANPVAGLGVMLGEQILRKPIQQFSSAKFSVTGTLDDPQVKFVSLWDKSMKAVPQPGSLAPVGLVEDSAAPVSDQEQDAANVTSEELPPLESVDAEPQTEDSQGADAVAQAPAVDLGANGQPARLASKQEDKTIE